MPKRFSKLAESDREPHDLAWSDLPSVYWKALLIALAIGLMSGVGWMLWRLFEVRVLR